MQGYEKLRLLTNSSIYLGNDTRHGHFYNGLHSESVNSFAMRQHLFDMAAKPIDVDSNFLSYPVPLFVYQFRPKCNHSISSW